MAVRGRRVQPVGGQVLSLPYSGHVSFAAPPVTIEGLPNNSSKRIAAWNPDRDGHGQEQVSGVQDLFLDPRTQRQAFSRRPQLRPIPTWPSRFRLHRRPAALTSRPPG